MRNKTKFGELTQMEIEVLKGEISDATAHKKHILVKTLQHVIELAETEVEYHLSDKTIKQLAEIISKSRADHLSAESVAKSLVDSIMERCTPRFQEFVRDTCEELRNTQDKIVGKNTSKEELRDYAHKNRERLKKQEVKLGDTVRVLVGHFAGEYGIVKEVQACCGYDPDDLFFSLEMQCEVPEKYQAHPNSLAKNVAGGFCNTDIEVVGNVKDAKPERETDFTSKNNMTKLELFNKKQRIANTITQLRDNQNTVKRIEGMPTAIFHYLEETANWCVGISMEDRARIDELAKQINTILSQGYGQAVSELENEFETL